jgi:hypothetical protein
VGGGRRRRQQQAGPGAGGRRLHVTGHILLALLEEEQGDGVLTGLGVDAAEGFIADAPAEG